MPPQPQALGQTSLSPRPSPQARPVGPASPGYARWLLDNPGREHQKPDTQRLEKTRRQMLAVIQALQAHPADQRPQP